MRSASMAAEVGLLQSRGGSFGGRHRRGKTLTWFGSDLEAEEKFWVAVFLPVLGTFTTGEGCLVQNEAKVLWR